MRDWACTALVAAIAVGYVVTSYFWSVVAADLYRFYINNIR